MNSVRLMSHIYAPTLKEVPAEAELASHQLLFRAGMIRKSAAGIYSFLPLGLRVLGKIERIVRDEMEAIGCQELLLPVVQPAELWKESGRWDVYGPELARLNDRHDRQFCLGPTHEEIITALVRGDIRSYRQLPLSLFQINMKFRDEIRPRFGLLRGREFIMKDAYSFHTTPESLEEHYREQARAYGNVCERLGLAYRPVEADSGQIGGKVTTEFMALADAGEAELVYCDCGYAANTEVASVTLNRTPVSTQPCDMQKIATPDVATIDDLSAFLKVDASSTIKALVGVDEEGSLTLFFVPGDRDLNEIKAQRLAPGFRMLSDDEFKTYGLVKGFIGPVGLTDGAHVFADDSLRAEKSWTVGANEKDAHIMGACPGRDFEEPQWADLITAKSGDICPECGKSLSLARGIEVGQVFQLGKKYSESMGATYLDENGRECNFYMGCYGIGVSRAMAAIIEQHNDDRGIAWPTSVAPYEVAVIPLAKAGDPVYDRARELAQNLGDARIETVFDDRAERPGVKFADADLIGWPVQVVVGKKGYDRGIAEVKIRATSETIEIPFDEVTTRVANYIAETRA